MIERRFRKLWEDLQGKKPHMPHFLTEVRLEGIRGFDGLQVRFDYPVSVIAGGNATGKSTVLFAAACAYKVPGAGPRDYAPSTLFPDYRPKTGRREDEKGEVQIELAETLRRSAADICRAVARWEAERPRSDIQPLVEGLEDALQQWRSQ